MTDIVERLRTAASNNRIQAERGTTTTGEILTALGRHTKEAVASMHDDSADEITRLRSELKDMAEALETILEGYDTESEVAPNVYCCNFCGEKNADFDGQINHGGMCRIGRAQAALTKYRGKE